MCVQHVLFLAYVSAYVSGGASYVFPYVFLSSANSFGGLHLDVIEVKKKHCERIKMTAPEIVRTL